MAPDITVARHMVRAEHAKKFFPCDPRGLGLCRDSLPALFALSEKDAKAGRKIVCGFACLHRVGKAAATDFFVAPDYAEDKPLSHAPYALLGAHAPREPHEDDSSCFWHDVFIPARAGSVDSVGPDAVPASIEWAAVRQFDLLQEADNLAIYDLEVDEFRRAYRYLMYMRAGGYRLTVVTLGSYAPEERELLQDEQDLLDEKLNQEIAQLIHVLYLAKPSVSMTCGAQQSLRANAWRLEEALPHVAMVFGERDIFSTQTRSLEESLADQVLAALAKVPQSRVAHDVAVGLALPEFEKRKNWTYICKGEEQARLFQMAITNVFAPADWISVAGLQSGQALGRDETAVMRHMRGYGFHTETGSFDWCRDMARQSGRFASCDLRL